MEKTTKKIVGGLMIAMLIAMIGAVIVSAETDETDDSENWHMPFNGREKMEGKQPFNNELTEEQQEEIEELITSLTEEGATCDEIREAIHNKLDEMGILDERLDKAIEKAGNIFNVDQNLIRSGGKQPDCVKARSVAAYWATQYLGMTATEISREIGLSKSAVSRSVTRGRSIVSEQSLSMESLYRGKSTPSPIEARPLYCGKENMIEKTEKSMDQLK